MSTRVAAARVIVTRPERDAEHWVQQLQQGGFDALALPLIDITAASATLDAQALQQAWQSLGRYAGCMFVSGNAVAHFFKQKVLLATAGISHHATNNIANAEFGTIPPELRFMAPGPGTAAALRAAGVPDAQIDAPPAHALQFDSQALWQVVGQRDWQGRRVLVVRGQSQAGAADAPAAAGRDWLLRQWQGAGATVDVVSVYARRAPTLTARQFEQARLASADGSVWLFSSSEAVANLLALPGLSVPDWRGARAIATHPRIEATLRAAGWGVVVSSRPALQDIVDTLRSIESRQP